MAALMADLKVDPLDSKRVAQMVDPMALKWVELMAVPTVD
jgi:hypothetical protein